MSAAPPAPPHAVPAFGRIGGALRRILTHADVRNAGLITAGTVAAQVVLLVTMPVLSRLYTPEDFGRLALLITVSTIGGSVATLCYNYVILLAKPVKLAAGAYQFCLLATLAGAALVTALYAALAAFATGPISQLPHEADLALVFLGVAATAYFNVIGTAQTRFDRFRAVALSKFNLSAMPALVQIGLGLAGLPAAGLQVGRVVGQMLTVATMTHRLPRGFRLRDLFRPTLKPIRVAALRYRDSLLHIPRVLFIRGAATLPSFLLVIFYGPAAAGFYFLAERLIDRPGLLLSDTLTRLPMKVFAERLRAGRPLGRAAAIYTIACALVVVPGVALIAAGGPWLFQVLFGPTWSDAAFYAVPLAVLAGVRLTALPLTAMVTVLRLQRVGVILDGAFFLRVGVFPLAAWLGFGAVEAVNAFAALSVAYNLSIALVASLAVRSYDQTLAEGHKSADTPDPAA